VAKHQLIISKETHVSCPVRSEAGQLKPTRTLVVNWKGTWEPRDQPDHYLVVAPGDELELVLSAEQREGGSLWLLHWVNPSPSVLSESQRQGKWEHVDLQTGSVRLQVNPDLAHEAGESRYELRITALGQIPAPIVGQGQAGTLTATKP
jgi:hypothetical protein